MIEAAFPLSSFPKDFFSSGCFSPHSALHNVLVTTTVAVNMKMNSRKTLFISRCLQYNIFFQISFFPSPQENPHKVHPSVTSIYFFFFLVLFFSESVLAPVTCQLMRGQHHILCSSTKNFRPQFGSSQSSLQQYPHVSGL